MILFSCLGKIIHPIKSHSGALVSHQVSSLLRVLVAPFALWVALQSIQPGNLLSLGCNGESFSKKTSEKQSRNWNRIALYNLFHSHWWEKTVEQQVEWKNISACVVLLIGAILSSVFRLIVECTN